MTKTFDDIQKENNSELIFSRFALSSQYDQETSFIPAPFNIIALPLIICFHLFELAINWIRKRPFDLSLCLMPTFMKQTTLELDEQISHRNCGRLWEIEADKDKAICAITDFNADTMKHTVKFFQTDEHQQRKPLKVSILPHTKKKAVWNLNLLELQDRGLIDLQQFTIEANSKWLNEAHKSMQSSFWRCSGGKSSCFICAHCRSYVKSSKVSIVRLRKELHLSDIEMVSVYKQMKTPIICAHCFRVKREMNRNQLIAEIISFWIFRLLVWWILIAIFGALKLITNPKTFVSCKCCTKQKSKTYFCNNYYDDTLIANMLTDNMKDALFNDNIHNNVWNALHETQNGIDPLSLKDAINKHVMEKNIDGELTQFQFMADFVGIHDFKQVYGAETWNDYFKPLSIAIFNKIKDKATQQIPLHLLLKYPLNAAMCLDLLDGFWAKLQYESKSEEEDEESKQDEKLEQEEIKNNGQEKVQNKRLIINCTKQNIIDALHELKFLNCKNDEERRYILNKIETSDCYVSESNIYYKFMKYLFEVQSLFQNNHKINTLLRDIRIAMNDYGIDKKVNRDELQFLCTGINDVLVIPFMNTIQRDGNKLYLWDIWNNLLCLDYLKESVKIAFQTGKHWTVRMSEEELKHLVMETHQNDIISDKKQNSWRDRMERSYSENSSVYKPKQKEKQTHFGPNELRDIFKLRNTQKMSAESLSKKESIIASVYKSKITKTELMQNIEGIFEKTKQITKISVTTINTYFMEEVIESEEVLDFVYQQLSRFAVFNRNKMKNKCNENELIDILCHCNNYRNGYYIDIETIPQQIKDSNFLIIKKLYKHLLTVIIESGLFFIQTNVSEHDYKYDEKQTDSHSHSHSVSITIQDILTIISLYKKVYIKVQRELTNTTQLNCISHDVFVKFVDPEFELNCNENDEMKNKQRTLLSTKKSMQASELFGAAMDTQKNVISLGQIKECLNKLISDTNKMMFGYGGITRIINHLLSAIIEDTQESRQKSGRLYQENNFNVNVNAVKNAKLKLRHLDRKKWSDLIKEINKDCHLCNKQCDCILCQKEFKNYEFNMSVMVMHENEIFERKINRSIIRMEQEIRDNIFDAMLSFCCDTITLQQIFSFSVQFGNVLKRNEKITEMMIKYHKFMKDKKRLKHSKLNKETIDFFAKPLPKTFMIFKNEYFCETVWNSNKEKQEFQSELKYLYTYSKNIADLCFNLNLFWAFKPNSNESKMSIPHGLMILKSYDFCVNSQAVNGSHTLKLSQFILLKHSLGINDKSINKLFHIIRNKIKTLSLQQIYRFFVFLSRIKYFVQNAILQSEQREDTIITCWNMLKIELQIETDHQAIWLFDRVCKLYQAQLTWKQIVQHLQKGISLSTNIKDSFLTTKQP